MHQTHEKITDETISAIEDWLKLNKVPVKDFSRIVNHHGKKFSAYVARVVARRIKKEDLLDPAKWLEDFAFNRKENSLN